MIDYNNIPHSIRIVSFRSSWMPQTKEQERPAAKTCPIKYPAYDGTQPECFHDCALYDSRNNRCGLLPDTVKTKNINAARHPEHRLFAGLVRVPEPNKKP